MTKEFSSGYKGPVSAGDTLVNNNGDIIGVIMPDGSLNTSPQAATISGDLGGINNPSVGDYEGFDSGPMRAPLQSDAPVQFAGQGQQMPPQVMPQLPPLMDISGDLANIDTDANLDTAEIEAAVQRRLQQYNADLLQNETNFGQLEREADSRLPIDLDRSRDSAGSRGMLFSGGFLEEQGGIRTGLADYKTRILNDKNTGKLNLDRFRDEDFSKFDSQKRDVQISATRRRADKVAEQQAAQAKAIQQMQQQPQMPQMPQQPQAQPQMPKGPAVLGNGQQPVSNPGGVAPISKNFGNGQNPGAGVPISGVNPITGPMQGAAPVGYTGQSNQPTGKPRASALTPITQVGGSGGAREISSFDKASQNKLQQGGTVVGGDGRKFKLVNGVAAYIGV